MAFEQMIGIGARDDTGKAFASVNNNIKRTADNAKKLDGSLRMMRGGMGQLGHQIQDVAVQLQMGQNALMVLTQQGSQVASLFGPTGAIIGAIGAVAGALAASFMPSLMESEDKVDAFAEAMKNISDIMDLSAVSSTEKLTKKFLELAEISEHLAKVSIQSRLIETELALVQQQEALAGSTEELFEKFDYAAAGFRRNGRMATDVSKRYGIQIGLANELVEATMGLAKGTEGAEDRFLKMAETIQRQSTATAENKKEMLDFLVPLVKNIEQTSRLTAAQKQLNDVYENFDKALEESKKGTKDLTDENQRFVDSMVKQGETFKMTRSEQMQWELDKRRSSLEEGQILELEAAITRVRTIEQEIEQTKQARERQVEEERRISAELAAARVIEAGQAKNESVFQTNKNKLEAMRQSFMGEMELLAVQEEEKRAWLEGLADKYFTEEYTRQDALTQLEQEFADKRTKIAEDEAEKKRQIQQMGMDVIKSSLDFMASNLKEGTAIQKAAFLATKAFAASEAIVSAELAAAKALAFLPPPGNVGFAAFVRGMGYANAAMIMAQAVASFEGGGFTGRGARSGGLDGKGGFMAMLHPNETVTDHTRGGTGVTIINNIDAKGSGPDVDIKIRRAVELGGQQTVATIRDLASRGRLV